MIVLDAHAWVWWVHQDDRLSSKAKALRNHGSEVVTMDRRILSYPHVPLARMDESDSGCAIGVFGFDGSQTATRKPAGRGTDWIAFGIE